MDSRAVTHGSVKAPSGRERYVRLGKQVLIAVPVGTGRRLRLRSKDRKLQRVGSLHPGNSHDRHRSRCSREANRKESGRRSVSTSEVSTSLCSANVRMFGRGDGDGDGDGDGIVEHAKTGAMWVSILVLVSDSMSGRTLSCVSKEPRSVKHSSVVVAHRKVSKSAL